MPHHLSRRKALRGFRLTAQRMGLARERWSSLQRDRCQQELRIDRERSPSFDT